MARLWVPMNSRYDRQIPTWMTPSVCSGSCGCRDENAATRDARERARVKRVGAQDAGRVLRNVQREL